MSASPFSTNREAQNEQILKENPIIGKIMATAVCMKFRELCKDLNSDTKLQEVINLIDEDPLMTDDPHLWQETLEMIYSSAFRNILEAKKFTVPLTDMQILRLGAVMSHAIAASAKITSVVLETYFLFVVSRPKEILSTCQMIYVEQLAIILKRDLARILAKPGYDYQECHRLLVSCLLDLINICIENSSILAADFVKLLQIPYTRTKKKRRIEALASVLPGILNKLSLPIVRNRPIDDNYRIEILKLFTRFLDVLLSDRMIVDSKLCWTKSKVETDEKVGIVRALYTNLIRSMTAVPSNQQIREAIADMIIVILRNCSKLFLDIELLKIIIPIAIGFRSRDGKNTYTFLFDLIHKNAHSADFILDAFEWNIKNLPTVVWRNKAVGAATRTHIDLLDAYVDNFDEKTLLIYRTSNRYELMIEDVLCTLIKCDKKRVPISAPMQIYPPSMNEKSSMLGLCVLDFERDYVIDADLPLIDLSSDEQRLVNELIVKLYLTLYLSIDELCDRLRVDDKAFPAAYILEKIINNKKDKFDVNNLKRILELCIDRTVDLSLSITEKTDDDHVATSLTPPDICAEHLTCMQLLKTAKTLIGLLCARGESPSETIYQLVEVLVLNEHCASIKYHTVMALRSFIDDGGVSELIFSERDAWAKSVLNRIKHLSFYPRAPLVLAVLLNSVAKEHTADILPTVLKCTNELLLSLDEHYVDSAVNCVRALTMIIEYLRRFEDTQNKETINPDKLPEHILLAVEVLNRTRQLIGSRASSPLVVRTLKLLCSALETCRKYEKALLPMIHDNWAPLMHRARDADFRQQADIVETVALMAKLSKMFVCEKIVNDFLPVCKQRLEIFAAKGKILKHSEEYNIIVSMKRYLPEIAADIQLNEAEKKSMLNLLDSL